MKAEKTVVKPTNRQLKWSRQQAPDFCLHYVSSILVITKPNGKLHRITCGCTALKFSFIFLENSPQSLAAVRWLLRRWWKRGHWKSCCTSWTTRTTTIFDTHWTHCKASKRLRQLRRLRGYFRRSFPQRANATNHQFLFIYLFFKENDPIWLADNC